MREGARSGGYHSARRDGVASTTLHLVAARRRLPGIQSVPPKAKGDDENGGSPPDDDDAVETRPPWHWVGFGTVAIFAGWLPLAYVAQAVVARVLAQRFGEAASATTIAFSLATMPAG